MRVPLTFRWYLEYRNVLRCLRPSDLGLSDSILWSSRICPGFVRCASPCGGECARPAGSHHVGLAEIEVTGPFEDVWRRLPPPGAVVTWLVVGSRHEAGPVARAPPARPWSMPRDSPMRLLRMARALRGSVPPYVRAMRKSPCAATVTWRLTSLVWQTVSAPRPLGPFYG